MAFLYFRRLIVLLCVLFAILIIFFLFRVCVSVCVSIVVGFFGVCILARCMAASAVRFCLVTCFLCDIDDEFCFFVSLFLLLFFV